MTVEEYLKLRFIEQELRIGSYSYEYYYLQTISNSFIIKEFIDGEYNGYVPFKTKDLLIDVINDLPNVLASDVELFIREQKINEFLI